MAASTRRDDLPPVDRGLLGRFVYPITLGLCLLALTELIALGLGVTSIIIRDWDRTHYMDAARRFVETGTPYLASEVQSRFDYQPLTFLHPPVALYLMVPFSYLPPVLWYAVPVGIVVISIWRWNPQPWSWPILALCLAWPRTPSMLIPGNTDMWVAAFVALGCRYGWPGLLAGIKPSLAPLALAGAWRRSWWLILPVALLAAVPFGGLWPDWLSVVRHAPGDLFYSVLALPMVTLPLIAFHARRRPRPEYRQMLYAQ